MDNEAKRARCLGCRDDYYNGKNPQGIAECFMLKTARPVTRWKIGWWTAPDSVDAFTKVETLNCHSAPGRYALYAELPEHLRAGSAPTPETPGVGSPPSGAPTK